MVVVIQKDPDSQGKEGSLWPERVILMDTRLPSRQKARETVKRGWGKGGGEGKWDGVENREVMKTIHPSPDVNDTVRKRGFEILEAFPEVRQPISWEGHLSPSFSLCVDLLYQFCFCFGRAESINVNDIQLNQLDMQRIIACSNTEECARREAKQIRCVTFLCAGDAGGNSGEDIQLTTTITHVDGPSEIYKMTGKEAQE